MTEIPRLPGISRRSYDIVTPINFLSKPNKLFNRYFSLNTDIFYIRMGRERWVFLTGSDAIRFFSKLTLENVDPYEFRSRMYTLSLPNFPPPKEFIPVAQETTKIIKEFFVKHPENEITQLLIAETSRFIDEYTRTNNVIPNLHNFIIQLSTQVYARLFFGEALTSILSRDLAAQYITLDKNLSMIPLILPVFNILNKHKKIAKIRIEEYLLELVEEEEKFKGQEREMNIVNGYLRIKDKFNISNENVVWLLHAMFWAAVHYTSVHGVWIGIRCLNESEIRKNILKEQNDYDQVTPETIKDMIYLGGVIKESLRMECVFALPRRVVKEINYNGYIIPKGDVIAISPYVEHFNSKNFEDPIRYEPMRWLNTQINTQSLIPGGLGFFGCLGMDLSAQLLKIIWAYLLQNYDMKLVSRVPKRKFNLILLPPKRPVKVLIKRK